MSEPTTIIWVTLPSKGNQGAAIIKWRETTYDTAPYRGRIVGDYLLGLKLARYPVPAIRTELVLLDVGYGPWPQFFVQDKGPYRWRPWPTML